MPLIPTRPAPALPALALAMVCALPDASAVATATRVAYSQEDGGASITPFIIDDPASGLELTITPALEFSSGRFDATFLRLDDGPAVLSGLDLAGGLDIEVATEIDLGLFRVPVTAHIVGPLAVTQVSDSVGSLVDATAYVESTPGTYDVQFGPVDCTDSAFGVVCGALQASLGIEFPLDGQSLEAAPFPFAAGTFSDLGLPGLSSVTASIELGLPIDNGGGLDLGFAAEVTWDESGRTTVIVPEPSTGLLAGAAFAALAAASRNRGRRTSPPPPPAAHPSRIPR